MKSFKSFLIEYYTNPLSELIKHLNVRRLDDNIYWLYLGKEYYGYKADEETEYLFFSFLMDTDIGEYLEGEELEEYIELKRLSDEEDDSIGYDEFRSEKEDEYLGGMEEGDYSKVPEKMLIDFGKWVDKYALSDEDIKNWGNPKEKYVNVSDYPPCYFMSYEGFVKNDWLVHFSDTNSIESISRKGFKYGIRLGDMKGLALSTWKVLDDKELMDMDGYIFSYELDRFDTNLFETDTSFVIFQGSGIKVYHNGDKEFQVICMKESVKNFIPVYWNEEKNWYEIKDKETNRLYWKSQEQYITDVMEELNDWIKNNIRQYGGRIITKN